MDFQSSGKQPAPWAQRRRASATHRADLLEPSIHLQWRRSARTHWSLSDDATRGLRSLQLPLLVPSLKLSLPLLADTLNLSQCFTSLGQLPRSGTPAFQCSW